MSEVTTIRRRCALVALAAALALMPFPKGDVYATNFGSTACGWNCISVGNDRWHYVFKFDLTGNMSLATSNALFNVYDGLTRIIGGTTNTTANADVIVADNNYSVGAAGWVECPASAPQGGAHPDHWCQTQWLRFNFNYPAFFDDTASRNHIACHELGHTLGLRHNGTSSSCMTADTPNGSQTINSHDVSHINSYWRYQ